MTDQLPAEIAEAIEALEDARQCHAWEAASGSTEAIAAAKLDCETSRAALDAVILKHLRGGVSMSDVIAPLTFNGDDCFHPAGFETECQCIGCPRKLTDLGRSALAEEGGG